MKNLTTLSHRLVTLAAAAALFAGCASNPDKIDSAYVSPLKYQKYDCQQLASEMDYVGQRTTKLHQRLKKERKADNWQMGVGLVLFWPALFFLEGGDGPEAAEYSQLKGEFEALRQVSVEKKCSISSRSPEEIIKEAESDKKEAAEEVIEETDGVDDVPSDLPDPENVQAVSKIAKSIDCKEMVTLGEISKEREEWILMCEDGSSVDVHCIEGTCYVRQ